MPTVRISKTTSGVYTFNGRTPRASVECKLDEVLDKNGNLTFEISGNDGDAYLPPSTIDNIINANESPERPFNDRAELFSFLEDFFRKPSQGGGGTGNYPAEDAALVASLRAISLDSGRIPRADGNGAFMDSALVDSDGAPVTSEKSLRFPTGSAEWGASLRASSTSRSLRLEDLARGNQSSVVARSYGDSGSNSLTSDSYSELRSFEIQALTDAQSNSFEVSLPSLNDVFSEGFMFRPSEAGTANFVVTLNGTQIINNTSYEVTQADVDSGEDVFVRLLNAVDFDAGESVLLRYDGVNVSGTNVINHPNFGTGFVPRLIVRSRIRSRETIITDQNISDHIPSGGGDHPVTLRRDMPSEEEASAIARASLNGNSGIWQVANNQTATSNRPGATIRAQVGGIVDVGGNEISTSPVPANTVRLRAGTLVRVFSSNDFRVVSEGFVSGDVDERDEFDAGLVKVNINSRVNLNTDLTGEHTARVRLYGHDHITSLTLVVDDGGLFQTHSLNVPDSDGQHDIPFTISSLSTDRRKQLVFYLVVNGRITEGGYSVLVENSASGGVQSVVAGNNVSVDATDPENPVVSATRPTNPDPIHTFSTTTEVNAGNVDQFASHVSIWVNQDESCGSALTFNVEGLTQNANGDDLIYPLHFLIRHAGADQSSVSCSSSDGFNGLDGRLFRRNELIINFVNQDGSRRLFRRSPSASVNRTFFAMSHGDSTLVTIESAGSAPEVTEVGTEDPRLNQRFDLSEVTVSPNSQSGRLFYSEEGYVATAGEEFLITGSGVVDGVEFNGGEVLKALIDSPNLFTVNPTEWAVIRNLNTFALNPTQHRFVGEVSESDTDNFGTYLGDVSGVQGLRMWLSPFILDHAPFNASTGSDPNNPQQGEVGQYIGGDDLDGSDYDFRAALSDLSDFEGGGSPTRIRGFVYMEVTGVFDAEVLDDTYMEHVGTDGAIIQRYKLLGDGGVFRQITLLEPDNTRHTTYVFDTVGASDNFSRFNYEAGQTIRFVRRTVDRVFSTSRRVDVTQSIPDRGIQDSMLQENTLALIRADHSLNASQIAKLSGLNTSSNPTPWTSGDLYVKDSNLSSNIAHYTNVGQENGVPSSHQGTRTITIVIPKFVTTTRLQRSDDNSIKVPLTPIGTIALDNENSNALSPFIGRGYTATLPQSSFNENNPVGDQWIVDGVASNDELSGAVDSFKNRTPNYTDDSVTIQKLSPSVRSSISEASGTTPYVPSPRLTDFLDSIYTEESSSPSWSSIYPRPIPSILLTREFKALFDQSRQDIGSTQFNDLQGAVMDGFNGNQVFVYANENDRGNTAAPGVGSYILNTDTVIHNAEGQSRITTGSPKIMGFSFTPQRPLSESEDSRIFRLGSSSEPLLSVSHDEGLYLNVRRAGNDLHNTRTREERLDVTGGHWHSTADASAEIEIPASLSGQVVVDVTIRVDLASGFDRTRVNQITIPDVGSDHSIGTVFFNLTSSTSLSCELEYKHNNTDQPTPRRVLSIRSVTAITDNEITYNVYADYLINETWSASNDFVRVPVNPGDAHDENGLFNPVLWHTERVGLTTDVMVIIQNYIDGDRSADPEQEAIILTQGDHEGDALGVHSHRLYRALSEFDLSYVNAGNFISATSRQYVYRSSARINTDQARTLFSERRNNLGYYTDRGGIVERLGINPTVYLENGFIMYDEEDGEDYRFSSVNGQLVGTIL